MKYYCPMHPEVVSDKPGKCPKCNGMDLIPMGEEDGKVHKNHNTTEKGSRNGYYTCPMDPEIVSKEPGNCPKCGMRLEKMAVASEHGSHSMHDNMEQSFKRRFLISVPITLLIIILSPRIQAWLGINLTFPFQNLLLFALASFVVFYLGKPFYEMAWGEIKAKKYGMMTLVSLAVLSGYVFSVLATLFFPEESMYWEISTLVVAFLLGHWIEMRAVRGASGALSELAKMVPQEAHKLVNGKTVDTPTQSLVLGDEILIKPGERIPIDGIVLKGDSSVNEAMITGESVPVEKAKDSNVIGGTINADGSLTVRVTKVGEDTALSQMMELIRRAQETKPSVQLLADKAASYLTFIAIIVGSSTFLYWMFVNPQGAVFAATLAISVVVITCPHALDLAIPTVTTIATSLSAKNGILIQDMKSVEIARKLDYIVFDKTGTLTLGEFKVIKTIAGSNSNINEVLSLAAAVEYHSQHPLAKAVYKVKANVKESDTFKSFPGKGAVGKVGSDNVLVGNKTLLVANGVEIPENLPQETAGSIIYVAKNTEYLGFIVLQDEIRAEAKEAIGNFHKLGIKTAMLTGDNKKIADFVAKKIGIDTVFSEVLPDKKVEKIKELQRNGQIVAMVGDGVNDAAALTQANLGIAIGAGTGVAIESAEIVLIKNDIKDVLKAIKLSRATNVKMVQNLLWATGYNSVAIPIAAGVLAPWGIFLRPEWAAILMSLSSVIVVFNALLLKRLNLSFTKTA